MPQKSAPDEAEPSGNAKTMVAVPRPGSSLVAFWAVVAVAVLLVGEALLQGDLRVFAEAVAPAALVIWIIWMIVLRPHIAFDADHVVVTNPGRIIEIPWQRAVEVRQRLQIVIDLDDGSTVTCWGSPFPEKPGRRRATAESRREADVAGPLEDARRAANLRQRDAQVVRRWDAVSLAVGAACVVLCIAVFALFR